MSILLRRRAYRPSAPEYRYIDPLDTTAFPNYTGLWPIRLNGSESWKATGGGCYTTVYATVIKNQDRADVIGFCADYDFYPSIAGLADLPQDGFMFNGTASSPVNGNLSFKNANTTSASAWTDYLAEHPLTILISTNSPDTSVWKPAIRESDAVTGYWNGAEGFVPVHGGIPYYGENLITQDVIDDAYDNAWISSQYVWATASGSASFAVPVTVGSRYRIAWDTTDSDTVGTIFRYGFTNNNAPSGSNTLSAPRARTTPQDEADIELEASKGYLVIQAASGSFPANVGHLTVREMIGYDPSDALLTTLTGSSGGANSASLLNTITGR